MTFDGAVICEQGVKFALVCVKPNVVQNRFEAKRAISAFQPRFPGIPVVLVGRNAFGVPCYYGRKDIARFMTSVPVDVIPWKTFTF